MGRFYSIQNISRR